MNSNGTAAAVAVDQDRLVQELSDSIRQFNLNRVPILKKAFQDLGDPGVAELEKEYDSLRDAYFEVVRRQLDVNNQRYAELAGAASTRHNRWINRLLNLLTSRM